MDGANATVRPGAVAAALAPDIFNARLAELVGVSVEEMLFDERDKAALFLATCRAPSELKARIAHAQLHVLGFVVGALDDDVLMVGLAKIYRHVLDAKRPAAARAS